MSAQAPDGPVTRDSGPELLLLALGAVVALVAAPVVLAWWAGKRWAERPGAWRPVPRRLRAVVVVAAVAGYAVVYLASEDLAALLWPLRWPASLLGVLLWWAAFLPSALIVARLRARAQGNALASGRVDPTRADVVRSAAWEAKLRHLAGLAGADVFGRPPRIVRPLAVPTCDIGVTAVHDPRSIITRTWTRARSRSAESSWHLGPRGGGRLVLPVHPPRAVMFGGSGSGKTVAQHRMMLAALEHGCRVLWIDGKGDPGDARRLLDQADSRGLSTRWLDLAATGGRDAYDLWRGDGSAVARKAGALMPRAGTGGTEHFAAWETYALTALSQPPWRSSAELLARLRAPQLWVDKGTTGRQALAALTTRQNGARIIDSVAAQVAAALAPLAQYIDAGSTGRPFSLDDDCRWDLAVASIDAGAATGAERVAAALLMDLDAYRIARRPYPARPLLVVADEIGAVLNDPRISELVPRLMEQVRSQGIGLVIAAQSVETLGECGPRLLASGVDLWVGRVDAPDEMAMLIGTTKVTEQAHQGAEHGASWTGQTAAREQDALMIHPQVLRELPPWTWLVKEPRTEPRWAVVPPLPSAPRNH